jgi:hypothetical protein
MFVPTSAVQSSRGNNQGTRSRRNSLERKAVETLTQAAASLANFNPPAAARSSASPRSGGAGPVSGAVVSPTSYPFTLPSVSPLLLSSFLTSLTFSSDGALLAFGASSGQCGVWRVSDRVRRGEEEREINDIVFVPLRRSKQKKEIQRKEEEKRKRAEEEEKRRRAAEEREKRRLEWLEDRRQIGLERQRRMQEREEKRRLRLYGGSLPEESMATLGIVFPPQYRPVVQIEPFNRGVHVAALAQKVVAEGDFLQRLTKDLTYRERKYEQREKIKEEQVSAVLAEAEKWTARGPPSMIKQRQSDFLARLQQDLKKRKQFERGRDRYYKGASSVPVKEASKDYMQQQKPRK